MGRKCAGLVLGEQEGAADAGRRQGGAHAREPIIVVHRADDLTKPPGMTSPTLDFLDD
jgi:hypothetical protein